MSDSIFEESSFSDSSGLAFAPPPPPPPAAALPSEVIARADEDACPVDAAPPPAARCAWMRCRAADASEGTVSRSGEPLPVPDGCETPSGCASVPVGRGLGGADSVALLAADIWCVSPVLPPVCDSRATRAAPCSEAILCSSYAREAVCLSRQTCSSSSFS